MLRDLDRLVTIRALRLARAERELRQERAVLEKARAKVEAERHQLVEIEIQSRHQQESLCLGKRRADEAFMAMNFVLAHRLMAKQVKLRVNRAAAETAQALKQVEDAHEQWRRRAKAHDALKTQEETLSKKNEMLSLARSDEAIADEHIEAWIARSRACPMNLEG